MKLPYSPAEETLGERGAFWRAIVDAPFDAAPRLIYADYLDDRGEDGGYLRAWQPDGGYDDISNYKAHAGCCCHDVGNLNRYHGWEDWFLRPYTCWVGDLTIYFQAVREGLFFKLPIQRILLRDFERLFVSHPGETRLRWSNEYCSIGELNHEMCRATGLLIDSAISGYVFYKPALAVETASRALVALGRRASGLSVIEIPLEPNHDYLYEMWRLIVEDTTGLRESYRDWHGRHWPATPYPSIDNARYRGVD